MTKFILMLQNASHQNKSAILLNQATESLFSEYQFNTVISVDFGRLQNILQMSFLLADIKTFECFQEVSYHSRGQGRHEKNDDLCSDVDKLAA